MVIGQQRNDNFGERMKVSEIASLILSNLVGIIAALIGAIALIRVNRIDNQDRIRRALWVMEMYLSSAAAYISVHSEENKATYESYCYMCSLYIHRDLQKRFMTIARMLNALEWEPARDELFALCQDYQNLYNMSPYNPRRQPVWRRRKLSNNEVQSNEQGEKDSESGNQEYNLKVGIVASCYVVIGLIDQIHPINAILQLVIGLLIFWVVFNCSFVKKGIAKIKDGKLGGIINSCTAISIALFFINIASSQDKASSQQIASIKEAVDGYDCQEIAFKILCIIYLVAIAAIVVVEMRKNNNNMERLDGNADKAS